MRITNEILLAVLLGEASDTEQHAVREWIKASPDNEATYRELLEIWDEAEHIDWAVAAGPPTPVERIIELAERKSPERKSPVSVPSPPRSVRSRNAWGWASAPRLAWGLAAAGLAAVALVADRGFRDDLDLASYEYNTDSGEMLAVRLRDGTIARLAPETRLTVERSSGGREVRLEGQAYFAVTRSATARFVVHTPAGAATVLGTRFNVRAGRDHLDVTVVEGEVAVSGAGGEASVKANQVGQVVRGSPPRVRSVEDVYSEISWLGDFVALRSTRLEDVLAELDRRFDLRVEVLSPVLLDRTVTGWFADQTPKEILAAVCHAVNAICSLRDDVVVMEASVRP